MSAGRARLRRRPVAPRYSPRLVSQETTRRVVALALGVLLVVAFAAFASDLSEPTIPDDAIAVVEDVDNGAITNKEFDSALEQVAASQGGEVPKKSDPTYQQYADAAASDLILARWISGEAADLGITASDREVEQRLDQIKKQNFGSEQEFQKFLDQSGFTPEQALDRVRLTVLSSKIQDEVTAGADEVSQDDIETVYEQQISQFTQPESRDVLVVANKDKAKVEQAKSELEKDDSKQNWSKVAAALSTDPSSKDGGLLSDVQEGQSDPAFDDAVFSADQGEIVGPFKTQTGWEIAEVVKITAKKVQPLDDQTSKAIEQQLATAQQQAVLDAFQTDLEAKWRERTVCSDELLPTDPAAAAQSALATRCSNFDQPETDSCTIDDPKEIKQAAPEQLDVGCPAPVASRNPATPFELTEDEQADRQTAQLQPLQQPWLIVPGSFPQGLPQRPLPPPPSQPLAGALPPGAAPIGAPTGAPTGAPPTAAPPTGAPPTAAPPTGAPPTGAPPTGAPPAAP